MNTNVKTASGGSFNSQGSSQKKKMKLKRRVAVLRSKHIMLSIYKRSHQERDVVHPSLIVWLSSLDYGHHVNIVRLVYNTSTISHSS